ncbi:unnamed protein product [Calypogeia fissa]
MILYRNVASLSSSGIIGINSSSARGMVVSGGTVYCKASLSSLKSSRVSSSKVEKSLINSRVLTRGRGGMGCGFLGVEVDLDGMMASRSGAKSSSGFVVRAQRSKFFKKYTRSSQDKIEILVKALCTSKESAAQTLETHGSFMMPPDWFNVLDGIGRRRRWLLALEVFRWIQVQKWYKADNGFYAKLISIMGKERQYRLAMTMFKEMKKVGCRPDTSLYNSVMTVFLRRASKKEGFAKALSLLEEMKLIRRCQPNIVTYNILTRAAAQMGDQDKVDSLLKEIFDRDLSADNYTYNGIMDAYGKAGEISMMEAMFKRMRDEKIKPDLVSFNTLIDAYGKAGEFEKMEQVFWSMTLKRTPPILPASKTFNSMITNYGNAGLLEKVDSVFLEMKKLDVSQTFVTFEALVGAYGKCGQFDKMRNCLKIMESDSYKPQPSTLNKMLDSYCSHGMATEAEDLLKNSLREFSVEPASLSYAIVIRAYKKAGNRERVHALLDRMKTVGIKPTKETYLDVMELIGIEVDYQKGKNDGTVGTVSDLDELSTLRTEDEADQEFLFPVEGMVGAAA